MGYSKDIYDDAFEELKARRNKAEYDAMIKHSELIKKLPRVQEIEESLAKTSTMAARAVFADRISVREMLEKLKTQNLALQMELKTILEKNGYQSDYLDVHYSCKECSDKGYIDGKMCLCLNKLLREKAYDKLNSVSPLSLSDFKTFSLDYYSREPIREGEKMISPYTRMEKILNFCESYAVNFTPQSRSILFQGGSGLGKTHLMHSIGHFILERNPNAKVLYVTSEEFTNEVIESIRSGNASAMNKLREKYRTIDVLMVDDVQFIIGKESTQEEFFHTFNALHSAGKQIILTSDKPPKDMETLEDRIRSRFEWGLIADIGTPDYETRMAILRRKVEADDMKLSDEILNYIATNIKSNIRELEGALNKLLAYSNLEKTDITMEIAMKELQNIITPDKPREITPQLVIEVVTEHFNISLDQMISKNRSNEIARPRQIAMYLCKNMTDIPLDSIGQLLGGRDHSTIIHGIKKIADEYESNENTRNLIETIKKKINPN